MSNVARVGGATAGAITIRVVIAWVSLVVLVVCLTLLFLGMRSVMEIGGACASGGPYVVQNTCPKGVWMVPVSIWVGLVAVFVHAGASIGLPGPKFALLAWPALFLSLGWNFWEYGLDPPGDGGVAVGWIVCGVVFVLMGGLPLLALLASSSGRRALLWSDARTGARANVKTVARIVAPTTPRRTRAGTTWNPPSSAATAGGAARAEGDLASDLERIAALYRRGDLTPAEYAAAKARLLGGEAARP